MTNQPTFETISTDQLVTATGGAGFDLGSLGANIGGLVDSFSNKGDGKGAQIGSQIGGIAQQFMGMFGGGGMGGLMSMFGGMGGKSAAPAAAAAPQPQAAPAS